MTPERWREITDLFQAALARDTVSRDAFLDERCRDDADLRAEVATLLAAHLNADALDRPIASVPIVVVGTRIGPYRLDALVGEGGMGQVFRARDVTLGRDVAIKVLPAALMADPQRHARFAREARLLAALNHPHIAHVYGFEERDGIRALVMELVDGQTLGELLAGARLPLSKTLALARQIAQALDAAHDKGIVHRDLKPANIKVTSTDEVKVLDFGLAKALAPDGADVDAGSSPTVTAQATAIGTILGTAAYMAPEQASGRAVDKRADIWAFGVVLFEMLTGRRLFAGETVNETLAAVLRQEIDWAQLPADTPSGVQRLLRRCLERDRHARLRDIGDALVELDAPTESAAATATPPARRRLSLVLPWTVAAIATCAAGALMWARSHESGVPATIFRSSDVIPGVAGEIAVSRDGTQIAYSHGGTDGTWLMWRRLADLGSQRIPGAENGAAPVFSPDGQWIAYTGSGPRIFKIPVAGGTPIPLCDGDLNEGGTWTDDGDLIFGHGRQGLVRVSAAGGTPEVLTTVNVAGGEGIHLTPQVLPDGRHVLFTVVSGKGPEFAVLDLSSKQYHTIAKGGIGSRYVGGYLTYVSGHTLYAVPFDAQRLTVTGHEVPVVENVFQADLRLADYSISDSGLLVYHANDGGGATMLAWVDRLGQTRTLPGAARQLWKDGRLSPNGTRLVNTILGDRADVWVMDIERGGTLRPLTFEGTNSGPIWTPDGLGIIYWSRRPVATQSGLYRVAADGSGHPSLILATSLPTAPTSISPDGDTLLFAQAPDGSSRIFSLALNSTGASASEPQLLHEAHAAEGQAEIAPDGQWVAYMSAESGSPNVYVQSFPASGAPIQISPDGGIEPRWARNPREGRALYYWSRRGSLMRVAMSNPLSPGSPELVFSAPRSWAFAQPNRTPRRLTWDVSPDRDRFLVELPSNTLADTTSRFVFVTNWLDELRQRLPPTR